MCFKILSFQGNEVVTTEVFGIYTHIPFCVHRCSYCDFYSNTQFTAASFERLAEKLEWEAAEAAVWLASQHSKPKVTSIFFGGGTPSLMPVPLLARVFGALTSEFELEAGVEITLEANPETVSVEFVEGLLGQTPVNRVSLGAQSFQPEHLASLERRGSAESIRTAVARLRASGLRNYSLDLIFGIPKQAPQQLLEDIDAAAALEPKHISFYSLSLKPAHPLYSHLPSEDLAADLYELGQERLAHHGYQAYEISNFSKPGFESRHNLLYWSGGDFLGLGPSAASRFYWDGVFHHRKQISHQDTYLKMAAFPEPSFESTNPKQTVLEATFLELRKRQGIELGTFHARYGYDLTQAKQYGLLKSQGMVDLDGTHLRLTTKGWLLAEGVAERLVDY